MHLRSITPALILALSVMASSVAHAVVITSFTEDFDTSAEGWISGAFGPLTHNASGGPDGGGFVSLDGTFADYDGGVTAFRGHDDFNASSDAFVGDWTANDWVRLSAWVKHDGPAPASFFVRIATSGNFPAAVVPAVVPVVPNVWTELEFNVSPNSPLLIFEGPFPYESVFESVGNIQFGLSAPPGFEDDTTPITISLDKVTVSTPEPTSLALLSLGASAFLVRRRRG